MYYIVYLEPSECFVNHAYLGSANGPHFGFCRNGDDAHQFSDVGAAETVAFLTGGQVVECL